MASQEDINTVLSAVKSLEHVKDVLTAKLVEEPALKVALEYHVQQIISEVQNLNTFKQLLQAKENVEPLLKTTVSIEIQQVLNAAENLNIVKDLLEQKCALEPKLYTAETILSEVATTSQTLQNAFEVIQGKMLQEEEIKQATQLELQNIFSKAQSVQNETKADKAINIQEPAVKTAIQSEMQQSLLLAEEVQQVSNAANAVYTQVPFVKDSAKVSGVASFVADKESISMEESAQKDKEFGAASDIDFEASKHGILKKSEEVKDKNKSTEKSQKTVKPEEENLLKSKNEKSKECLDVLSKEQGRNTDIKLESEKSKLTKDTDEKVPLSKMPSGEAKVKDVAILKAEDDQKETLMQETAKDKTDIHLEGESVAETIEERKDDTKLKKESKKPSEVVEKSDGEKDQKHQVQLGKNESEKVESTVVSNTQVETTQLKEANKKLSDRKYEQIPLALEKTDKQVAGEIKNKEKVEAKKICTENKTNVDDDIIQEGKPDIEAKDKSEEITKISGKEVEQSNIVEDKKASEVDLVETKSPAKSVIYPSQSPSEDGKEKLNTAEKHVTSTLDEVDETNIDEKAKPPSKKVKEVESSKEVEDNFTKHTKVENYNKTSEGVSLKDKESTEKIEGSKKPQSSRKDSEENLSKVDERGKILDREISNDIKDIKEESSDKMVMEMKTSESFADDIVKDKQEEEKECTDEKATSKKSKSVKKDSKKVLTDVEKPVKSTSEEISKVIKDTKEETLTKLEKGTESVENNTATDKKVAESLKKQDEVAIKEKDLSNTILDGKNPKSPAEKLEGLETKVEKPLKTEPFKAETEKSKEDTPISEKVISKEKESSGNSEVVVKSKDMRREENSKVELTETASAKSKEIEVSTYKEKDLYDKIEDDKKHKSQRKQSKDIKTTESYTLNKLEDSQKKADDVALIEKDLSDKVQDDKNLKAPTEKLEELETKIEKPFKVESFKAETDKSKNDCPSSEKVTSQEKDSSKKSKVDVKSKALRKESTNVITMDLDSKVEATETPLTKSKDKEIEISMSKESEEDKKHKNQRKKSEDIKATESPTSNKLDDSKKKADDVAPKGTDLPTKIEDSKKIKVPTEKLEELATKVEKPLKTDSLKSETEKSKDESESVEQLASKQKELSKKSEVDVKSKDLRKESTNLKTMDVDSKVEATETTLTKSKVKELDTGMTKEKDSSYKSEDDKKQKIQRRKSKDIKPTESVTLNKLEASETAAQKLTDEPSCKGLSKEKDSIGKNDTDKETVGSRKKSKDLETAKPSTEVEASGKGGEKPIKVEALDYEKPKEDLQRGATESVLEEIKSFGEAKTDKKLKNSIKKSHNKTPETSTKIEAPETPKEVHSYKEAEEKVENKHDKTEHVEHKAEVVYVCDVSAESKTKKGADVEENYEVTKPSGMAKEENMFELDKRDKKSLTNKHLGKQESFSKSSAKVSGLESYKAMLEKEDKLISCSKIDDKVEESYKGIQKLREKAAGRRGGYDKYTKSEEENYKENKLYVDESTTSDYSSESISEPLQTRKSYRHDTKQWVTERKSRKDYKEDTVSSVSSRHIKREKSSSVVSYDSNSFHHAQLESKPQFCGRLVDRTAAQGSRVKVTCSLTGLPEPKVVWYKDGHLVGASDNVRIQTRLSNGLASLEISEATVGDSGKYTCVARNLLGETTTTSNIKIFSYLDSSPEAPRFTTQITDQYKSSADELVIECRVRGYPEPTITWSKDNKELPARSRYQQSVLRDGTCRLVVHGPEPNDSGLYMCTAENSVWSQHTSAFVMFEGRDKYLAEARGHADVRLPRFTNIATDHVIREGGTLALQVAVKGTPRAEVTWYRGTDPLPKKSSRFRYLEDSGIYSLVVSEASRTEAGVYTCRATNAHGHRDTSVHVEVVGAAPKGKPAMFVSRPETSMSVAVGEDVSVAFRVSGDPKPKVTWMKNMKDITTNMRTLKETVNDYVRLTLKYTTIMDAGTYFIQAKNTHGTDYAFVTVKVKQRARSLTPTGTRTLWSGPDTSTILRDIHESSRASLSDVPGPIAGQAKVSDSGKNWVSLTWGKPEHRGAAPVLAYKVEAWLLGSEGGAQWTELGVTPINSFDAFFLKPAADYKFRVTARNRYGWGESVTNTEPITVGSASNFPPDIVRDLPGPVKALLRDSITLECEVAGDPYPQIQWLRDGQDVGTLVALRGRVSVYDNQLAHHLTIKQLTAEDSGRYVCEAVNKLGRASTYARLLVVSDSRLLDADKKLKEGVAENQESAPQFTMRLRDRRVQASYPVRLSCQVVGNPAPSITWAHKGEPVANDDRHQLVAEADHFQTLEISRTQLEDSGEYTVTAQNCLGAVSCHCQLTVDKGIRGYIAPDFISELAPVVTVKEGAELRLFAQVEAYPTVGISWQKDGVRLRPCRRLVMTVDPQGRVELALAYITARDAGLYTCSANNAVGRAETACQVSVNGGSPTSASLPSVVSSSVPYSAEPRFVMKPLSSEAEEGDTVIISCEVVGDPHPQVMWLRDWLKPDYYRDAPQFRQVQAGGSQYSLEIPQVKLDFTGTYCVIAKNPHGEAKAIISLQIYAKGQGKGSSMVSGQVKHGKVETLPEIKRGLKDLRCCDGDSATLECEVLATPPPSVRWEKEGKILPLGEDIETEVDGEVARLTIKKVYPEDEGTYSCVAYNQLGRAVTSACLVVDVPEEKETLLSQQLVRPPNLLSTRSTPRSTPRNTPSPGRSVSPIPTRYREFSSPSFSRPKRIKMSSPKFYTVPHNRIAEEGETVRFQCSVAGHPTPWASWDKDGHIVTPGTRLSVTERDDVRTLELREVTVEDAGLYRVTLENEMGSVEATARLDVIGRQGSRSRSVRAWSGTRASPTFGRRLVGSAARVGGTFTLNCDIHASPSPVTSWYRNGEMLVMTERVVPSWDGRRARLELRGVQEDDAGVYTCVAENVVGTTQCSAELRVLRTTDPSNADLQPPVFLQGLPPELSAEEGQPLELQTRLQGSSPLEVVWVKDGVEIPDCEDFRYVDYGDGRFGLRIADVFVADLGTYNCEAFNDHGDAITSGHLIVTDTSNGDKSPRPEEPEICFTKTPSPVLAPLRGQASFCARLQGRPLSHTSFTWTVAGHTVTSADDRFKVAKEGDSSVLHIAEVRASDMGPVTCTARVCSPSVPPTIVSCGTQLGLDCVSGCPASLQRGPSDTTAMRGDRVMLKAIYRGSPEPTVRWLKAGRELHTEGRVQITTREGVSCLTISSITADDSGKYVVSVENVHGADCHFASVAVEGPPEPPAARPSVSCGEGFATVAWSSPPYDGGCVLTGYCVEMRTADSQDWSVVADRCHSLSHVVQGLVPGQTYVFRVRAENIHGASESSVESLPTTFESPRVQETESESISIDSRQVTLEPGEQFLQQYSVHEELGKGRYGVVHKVTDLHTGNTMAAKFVRCIKKQDREKVQEEIDIMNCLRHPKLLQLTAAFENPKDIVMIMEYISGGELFERVVADDFTLTERDCIIFLRQICEGVSYMHKSHVVHLDLKPENIMCHTRTSHRIKIIDFGLAQKLDSNTPVRVLFGTPEFIPPEIINYEPIGSETDMWSVGVICYVLLSGLSPFMGDNDAETFANITRADYDFDDEAFDAISQDAKDFISALLVKRQEKRLTADECLQHKWMTQCDMTVSCVKLSTDKLKKFIIRRKWQPRNVRQIA